MILERTHWSLAASLVASLAATGCTVGDEEGAAEDTRADLAPGVPDFQAPFACGQSWTFSHHSAEVRLALDFVSYSNPTNGAPVLASAAGTATRHYEGGGAGNYVVIDHGNNYQTNYFHLSAFSIDSGARVEQGQEIGRVGTTGASSGPHLHYEQRRGGPGLPIVLDGQALTPYPASYGQREVVSRNCGGGGGTRCGDSPRTVGLIDAKYRELGGCGSVLGAPITDEQVTPDGIGRFSVFERGSIYWTPALGAFEVHGLIRDHWKTVGWEVGVLGYPVSDEVGTPDGIGRYNVFEHGSIYWSPDTGAHEVVGLIRDAWAELGWEAGTLGYPITGEYAVTEGRASDFQHGTITWNATTNATTVTPAAP